MILVLTEVMEMYHEVNECVKITSLITFFEVIRKGGYNFSGENCDFWECVYVDAGYVSVSINEHVYDLKEGDIIFHQPSVLHKYHVKQNQQAKLFIFAFTITGSYVDFFKDKVFTLNNGQLGIIRSLQDFIHKKMPNCHNDKDGSRELRIILSDKLLCAILINHIKLLMLSVYDDHDYTLETTFESAVIFKQAVQYMNDNCYSKLTIRSISEKCCTNTTALKKIFAEYAGCGVHKYFLSLKIAKAASLLSEGYSTSETAELLGFSSQAYFSTAFKRETGVSPTNYKKQN